MGSNTGSIDGNPNGVAVGRRNAALRRPWTDEARTEQRERCLLNKPWKASNGPRTPQGKAKVAANGRGRKPNPGSARQLQMQLAGPSTLLGMMQAMRREMAGAVRDRG